MPLNYDISKIAMYKDNFDDAYTEYTQFGDTYQDVKPFLKGLIFAGGMVAIGSITFKNVSEWYARLKLCEEMYNTYLISRYDQEQEEYVNVPLEAKELVKYIGLSTNHSTISRGQWVKNVKRNQTVDLTTSQMQYRLKKLEEEFQKEVFK
jgi:hypothetical protein